MQKSEFADAKMEKEALFCSLVVCLVTVYLSYVTASINMAFTDVVFKVNLEENLLQNCFLVTFIPVSFADDTKEL